MILSTEQIDFINKNEVLYFATASKDSVPRVIPVVPTIVNSFEIILADMQMSISNQNVKDNKNVFLYSIDSDMNKNLKISGMAEYFTSGKYFDEVVRLELERESGLNPRGAIRIVIKDVVSAVEE